MYDPSITPNWTFFPFMQALKDMVGSTVSVVLVFLVGTLVISALVWGGGNLWDHGRASHIGKGGVVLSIAAAFLVGGGSALIRWAATQGASL